MSIYDCHNKPRPVQFAPLAVQDGWYRSTLSATRYPKMSYAPFVMSTKCKYDNPNDPHCAGCQHQKGDVSHV